MNELGELIFKTYHNQDDSSLHFRKGARARLSDTDDADYGVYQRNICKMASEWYANADKAGCTEQNIYEALSKRADWYPRFDQLFVDPVLKVLGRFYKEAQKVDEDDAIEKAAGLGRMGSLADIMARAGLRTAPSMLQLLLASGALGGASLGAIHWALNRDMTEDRSEVEALKRKRDYYNRITNEISRELAENESLEDIDVEEAVEDAAYEVG
jgi:hypothetical protein